MSSIPTMYKQHRLYYSNYYVVCSNNVYSMLSTSLNYVICSNKQYTTSSLSTLSSCICQPYVAFYIGCSYNVFSMFSSSLNYVVCSNENTPHRLIHQCPAVYDKFRHIYMLLLYTVLLPVPVQSNDDIYTISPSQQVVYKSTLCRLFQQCMHNVVYITTMSTLCLLFQQCLQYVIYTSKLLQLFQLKHHVVSFNIVQLYMTSLGTFICCCCIQLCFLWMPSPTLISIQYRPVYKLSTSLNYVVYSNNVYNQHRLYNNYVYTMSSVPTMSKTRCLPVLTTSSVPIKTPRRLIQHCPAVYDKFRHIYMLLLYTVVLPVAVQSNVNIFTNSFSLQVVSSLHYLISLHYVVCSNNVNTTSCVRIISTLRRMFE